MAGLRAVYIFTQLHDHYLLQRIYSRNISPMVRSAHISPGGNLFIDLRWFQAKLIQHSVAGKHMTLYCSGHTILLGGPCEFRTTDCNRCKCPMLCAKFTLAIWLRNLWTNRSVLLGHLNISVYMNYQKPDCSGSLG